MLVVTVVIVAAGDAALAACAPKSVVAAAVAIPRRSPDCPSFAALPILDMKPPFVRPGCIYQPFGPDAIHAISFKRW
jgi:hypothetical protein